MSLGIDLQLEERATNVSAADEDIYDRTIASLGDLLNGPGKPEHQPPALPAKTISIAFNATDEAAKWVSDVSRADLISPPKMTALDCLCGETQTGVVI